MNEAPDTRKGILAALAAYLMWGVLPLYWKAVRSIPAWQVLCHRILWAALFLLLAIFLQKRSPALLALWKDRKRRLALWITAVFITANWWVYIWAVNAGFVLETSLGYYINPLVSVLFGVVFLGERMRPAQTAALVIATGGVLYLTLGYGTFPWIALFLAFTFATYGLLRKKIAADALSGLTIETIYMSPLVIIALFLAERSGDGPFLSAPISIELLLIGGGAVTALPLYFFAVGTHHLRLSTMGMLQYIAPTIQFFLAVYLYKEPFTTAHLVAFGCIWCAVTLYIWDSQRYYRIQSLRL